MINRPPEAIYYPAIWQACKPYESGNPMALTPKQKSFLRGKAHHLDPVVMLGKEGVSAAVLKAADKALEDHELIKIKVPSADQTEFRETVDAIMTETKAEVVQTIGHLLVLYRQAKKPGRISKELAEEFTGKP
jgi:RNA-binding protein